jgi:hypothetical protein
MSVKRKEARQAAKYNVLFKRGRATFVEVEKQ